MKITEIFANTGEVIERDATADELAQMKINKLEADEALAKAQSDATLKAALLERLGITAEEAALLLG